MRSRSLLSLLVIALPLIASAKPACDVVSQEVLDKLRGAGPTAVTNYAEGLLAAELRQCLKQHPGCMGHDTPRGSEVLATEYANDVEQSGTASESYTNFVAQTFPEANASVCILVYATAGSHFESYSWYGWRVSPVGSTTLLDLSRVDMPVQHSPVAVLGQMRVVHGQLEISAGAADLMVARAKADIRGLETALTMYRLDNRAFPTTEQGLIALVNRPADATHWRPGGYIKYLGKDPWGNDFRYTIPGTHGKTYDLYSLGPPSSDGKYAIIGNWDLVD